MSLEEQRLHRSHAEEDSSCRFYVPILAFCPLLELKAYSVRHEIQSSPVKLSGAVDTPSGNRTVLAA